MRLTVASLSSETVKLESGCSLIRQKTHGEGVIDPGSHLAGAGAGAAMSADMLAQVAGALGLPGLQFSWVGEPQGGAQPAPASGSDAAKHHGAAAEKAEAAGPGSSGRVPTLLPDSGAAAGGAAPGAAMQGGMGGGAGAGGQLDGGSQEAAAVPASDAGGAISAADSHQQAVDPESSDQSEL